MIKPIENDYLFQLTWVMEMDLDAEAMNNEDVIGNVLKPRIIILKDGTSRNAISGNMLKRIFVKNLRLLSDANELCSTCKIYSPMKNGKITKRDASLSESGNRVKNCIIDDVAGFMNAGTQKNEKRDSIIDFSWAIAREGVRDDDVVYTRVDPSIYGGEKKKEKGERSNEANENDNQNTQMLFYRPIRSSVYAITVQMDLHRIGFDDEKQIYALDKEQLKARIQKVLEAFRNTFLDIKGALSTTNLPHFNGIRGIVMEKTNRFERMTKVSALNTDFIKRNQDLSTKSTVFENEQEFQKVIDHYASDHFLDAIIERNMTYVEENFSALK